LTNAWAEDLFDFVVARNAPAQMTFPDVPRVVLQAGADSFNDPLVPLTDQDGRCVPTGRHRTEP
jgi:hypothetical protein